MSNSKFPVVIHGSQRLVNDDYNLGIIRDLQSFTDINGTLYSYDSVIDIRHHMLHNYIFYLGEYLSLSLELDNREILDRILSTLNMYKNNTVGRIVVNIFIKYPTKHLMEWLVRFYDHGYTNLYEDILRQIHDPKQSKNTPLIIDILVKYYDIEDICTYIVTEIGNQFEQATDTGDGLQYIPKFVYVLPYLVKHGFNCSSKLPNSIKQNIHLMSIIDSVLTDI